MKTNQQPPTEPQSVNYELWKHLHDEHGLILLESELYEIIRLAKKILVTEIKKA